MGSLLDRLKRAQASYELVRVSRVLGDADPVEGYVVDVGERWVLVAVLDASVVVDGFVAVPIADIARVKTRRGSREFVERALRLRDEWPPAPPAATISLGDLVPLVRSAARQYPTITIHIEGRDPDVCFIGIPVKFGRRSLRLLEVDPNAEWWDRSRKWAWSDITRVDFGGRYERTLFEVAGTPPSDRLPPDWQYPLERHGMRD
ncbi:hypothetical protein [Amycolatopsis sp. NPDC051128]|uniref:hypothetical protein n=1 Tax=Amycolatopsis sp. NPDC051128 TaxID=3155412 RepID=UPI003434D365